jgi:hypothetical protein
LQYIEIEYNQRLKPLETALSGVKQPGDFFVCGAIDMPMPRVQIEGAGTLSFPVPDAQIAAIVRRAERAPYGKGEATIIDTSVRKVWQISAGGIKVGKILDRKFREHPCESEDRSGLRRRGRHRRVVQAAGV